MPPGRVTKTVDTCRLRAEHRNRNRRTDHMKPLEIQVPSAQSRVVAFMPDKKMTRIASGRKIAPVLKRARKTMGTAPPLIVVVPKKNTTYVF